MGGVPRNVVNVFAMTSGESSRRTHLDLLTNCSLLALHTPAQNIVHTTLSIAHTLAILSTPTAPSFLPSQLHAIWFIACWWEKRMSRGRKAENVGAYGRKERNRHHRRPLRENFGQRVRTWRPRAAKVVCGGGEGGRSGGGISSSSFDVAFDS